MPGLMWGMLPWRQRPMKRITLARNRLFNGIRRANQRINMLSTSTWRARTFQNIEIFLTIGSPLSKGDHVYSQYPHIGYPLAMVVLTMAAGFCVVIAQEPD